MNESDCPQCQRAKEVLVQYQQMIHHDVESAEDIRSNDKMLRSIFTDLRHARQKLCTNQGEIDDLKKENEKQREDLGRQKKKIEKMTEERRDMRKERDTQKREWTSFSAKLAAVVEEQEVIDDERTEIEKAGAVILEMQQHRQETKAHREEIKRLSSNLEKARSDSEKQREHIKEQSASHVRLKRDLDTMKRKKDKLQQKLAAEMKKNEDVRNEMDVDENQREETPGPSSSPLPNLDATGQNLGSTDSTQTHSDNKIDYVATVTEFCSTLNVHKKIGELFLLDADWNLQRAMSIYWALHGDATQLESFAKFANEILQPTVDPISQSTKEKQKTETASG